MAKESFKMDCHIHTFPMSGCSRMSPEEAIDAAVGAGLDGIAITEHDCMWDSGGLQYLESVAGGRIKVFNGVEVSCSEGHFLVFGLKNMEGIHFGMRAEDLISIAHGQSAAVVVAHPYRFSYEDGEYCYGLDLDGVEVMSSNTTATTGKYAVRLAGKLDVFRFASSDAHAIDTVGKYFNVFPFTMDSVDELAGFLRRTKP
ncbi:MAG: PHP domain-containing protein [Nitrospirae bacterium]|nr:PHP domain-containing protein [Nitrospirota bacterium]